MQLKIFKRNLVHTLYQTIENNLSIYESGDFSELLADYPSEVKEIPDVFFDETMFGNMVTESGGQNDAKNAFIILNGLVNFNPYLATDERVWVALCHTEGKDFVRKRWIKPYMTKEKKIASIKQHFFAKGNRSFERQNALSSIWWWAYIATRHDPSDKAQAIETLCRLTDVRSQIFDRTSISRGGNTFAGLLKCIERKFKEEPDNTFFTRKKNSGNKPGLYKEWFSKINRWGGRKFTESFSSDELSTIFYDLMDEVEQNTTDS